MEVKELRKHILALAKDNSRLIVGIAGPPASGKSTLAEALSKSIENSVVVPMDGYHFSNDILERMGKVHRKGAHFTFDAEGFVQLIRSIKTGESCVNVPEFDRSQDKVVFKGLTASPENKIVIVEGNYLLLNEEPWSTLRSLFDLSISISPKLDEIEQRLLSRWLDHGHSRADALGKIQKNDLPNAEYILNHSVHADIKIDN